MQLNEFDIDTFLKVGQKPGKNPDKIGKKTVEIS